MNPLIESKQHKNMEEDDDGLLAMRLASIVSLPMVLKITIDLDLFEMIAKEGPEAHLSPSYLASKLPTKNPNHVATCIDRMLRLLASHSVVTCKRIVNGGESENLYGLSSVCKYFTKNEDGVSLAPLLLLFEEQPVIDCWSHFRESILDGEIPFVKTHGMSFFEYVKKKEGYQNLFNEAMYSHTTITMNKLLDTYKGFQDLNQVVDVGGNIGANITSILSKYPQIKAINFDLPHVIENAKAYPGVDHVGGDMFTKIPNGETIFMKWVLHDWNDEDCLKILENCQDALPETGKVIVLESIIPETPKSDIQTQTIYSFDMAMLGGPGGKERTYKEFETLANQAGFAESKIICPVLNYWVIEFYKTLS